MAVLVEAISVIIRLEAIQQKYPGGWQAFARDVPNMTLCTDDVLARVGFMSPLDVKEYVEGLERLGFVYERDGKAVDLVVADQFDGFMVDCQWARFCRIHFGGDRNKRVAGCKSLDEKGLTLRVPHGWDYENSLSGRTGWVENKKMDDVLEFIKHEQGKDVYRDKFTGETIYVARPG